MTADHDAEAVQRYEIAQKRVNEIRAEWEAAGSPYVTTLANGVETTAPLLKLLITSEEHAARLWAALNAKNLRPGRPPGSNHAPDRQPGPPKRSPLR